MSGRGRKGILRKRLRGAKSYEVGLQYQPSRLYPPTHNVNQEWKDAADVLDQYLHFDEWKQIEEDPYYDWTLVKKVLHVVASGRHCSVL